MPSISTSDIIRASDSTNFVDIARVKKFVLTSFLTYLVSIRKYFDIIEKEKSALPAQTLSQNPVC